MMKKSLVAIVALAGFVGVSGAAVAEPTIQFRAFQDGVLQPALTGSSTSGALAVNGSTSNFSFVSGVATGIPLTDAPSFSAQTTTISSVGGFSGPSTLSLEFTQTGVPSDSAGGMFAALASSFTANFLQKGNTVTSVTVSSYADADNTAFGQTILLGQQVFTASGASASPTFVTNFELDDSLFSETIVITAIFTEGGARVQSSADIVAVPAPASLALFGGALLGLGLVRRRRQV